MNDAVASFIVRDVRRLVARAVMNEVFGNAFIGKVFPGVVQNHLRFLWI